MSNAPTPRFRQTSPHSGPFNNLKCVCDEIITEKVPMPNILQNIINLYIHKHSTMLLIKGHLQKMGFPGFNVW